MALLELNPEVIEINKRNKTSWLKSGFNHIGSIENGSFTREWNVHDFQEQIKYLKNSDDPIFFLRVILQNKEMCDFFIKKMNVSTKEYWQNSYELEEDPDLTEMEYIKNNLWKSLAVTAEIDEVLRDLPDEFLLKTLKVYNKEISRIRDESLEKISEMRQDFIPNFKNLIDEPLPISSYIFRYLHPELQSMAVY